MHHKFRLLSCVCVTMVAVFNAPATSVWTGGTGDGQWTTVKNWNFNVPTNNVTPFDTAVFGNAGSGGTINWPSSTSRPKNIHIAFQSGAPSYNLNGDYIDNGAGSVTLTTASGMTNPQTVKKIQVGTFTWTLNGSGAVTITQGINNGNPWVTNQFNSATFAVNDASAVLTVGGFTQGKRYNTTKTGVGRLKLQGIVDWAFGLNAGAFVSGNYTASAGSLDVSTATLKLEDNSGGTALKSGRTYPIVTYSGATLVNNANFATFSGLPDGWEVVVDTASNRILLRELPRVTVVVIQ